ncbi:uncharacterized protein HKW66_Vig0187050 [Vigna angularis]|uniref:Rx N-terminal domain-containing protein n=1 Tax=Phaseolus angularis TaxID=3914 RepID=A0A8T0KWT3_PHAAN|nr:uncharacterized protein HKW66_Vig0187050 [Vigna angularis]
MAESLLFSFAESLIGKLATAAVQEASLALGVHSELKQMKATMALIKGVLLDAEKKNPQSSALNEWLTQIKRVFSDAEDIVDDFECEALRKHVVNTYGSCSRKVRRFFSSSNPVVYGLRMAHHIQDINTRLTKLSTQLSMFGLQIIDHDTRVVHVREMTHSHVNPSHVTGREHDKNEIVNLLMQDALGFLPPPKESESMVDVANHLVYELWSRSFLSDYFDLGADSTFTLHDLMYDLVVHIAKGEFERINLRNQKFPENAQHLVFMENNLHGQAFPHTGLKSVYLSQGMNNEAFLIKLVSRCKYLRILGLYSSEIESLPYSIGKLKHLRHLNLQFSKKLRRLPDSVCKLQNLQTLDLLGCVELQKLPKGMRNLISLRNLYITTKQVDFSEKDIAVLTTLENLNISYCDNLESLFNGIQLSTLKKLALVGCESLKSVPFHAIRNVNVLAISNCDQLELSMGVGSQIPDSRLKYVVLKDLPQLVTLPRWIQGSANSLQSLLILGCINLKELPDWLPTLIYLKSLGICECPNLVSLPDNMHQLTNLERLEMTACPELWKRFKPGVGQDWLCQRSWPQILATVDVDALSIAIHWLMKMVREERCV